MDEVIFTKEDNDNACISRWMNAICDQDCQVCDLMQDRIEGKEITDAQLKASKRG